jgi:hypothetical protein
MFAKRVPAGIVVSFLALIGLGYETPTASAEIWITRAEIRKLPTSGPAWRAVKSRADRPAPRPNVRNQNDDTDVATLAKALVYVRTGIQRYRTEVRRSCLAAIDTDIGGTSLALARNLSGYVIAAELVGLEPRENARFREWLRRALTRVCSDGRTLRSTHEDRPNNYGTHAGASRAAVAVYLGDSRELSRTARVFRGWLGDRSAYRGFKYGNLSWQCDPRRPVGINRRGCARYGVPLGGALPEELRRGGPFRWPPNRGNAVNYSWEALQGALVQAEILHRQGYDAWDWQDRALRRAVQFLYNLHRRHGGWWVTGDDTWAPWVVNHAYGTDFPATSPTRPGKNMGWTDWTHRGER